MNRNGRPRAFTLGPVAAAILLLVAPSLPASAWAAGDATLAQFVVEAPSWVGVRLRETAVGDFRFHFVLESTERMSDMEIRLFLERGESLLPWRAPGASSVEARDTHVVIDSRIGDVHVETQPGPIPESAELRRVEFFVDVTDASGLYRGVAVAAAHTTGRLTLTMTVTASPTAVLLGNTSGTDVTFASRYGGFEPQASVLIQAPTVAPYGHVLGGVAVEFQHRAYLNAIPGSKGLWHYSGPEPDLVLEGEYGVDGGVTRINGAPGARTFRTYVSAGVNQGTPDPFIVVQWPDYFLQPQYMPRPIGARFLGADVIPP